MSKASDRAKGSDEADEFLAGLQAVTLCSLGAFEEDPSLARQREAGEEDQSEPGWDDMP